MPRALLLTVLAMACAARAQARLTLPPTPLSADQAAVHLLNRAAFGPSRADLDTVKALGPARWLTEQLAPGRDEAIEQRLSGFKTLKLSVAEALAAYPTMEERAKEAGISQPTLTSPEGKEELRRLMREKAVELPRELLVELIQARLLREANSRRQFEEVLVGFWFNHFNVSWEKGKAKWMVTAYERDAIRPLVFGRFRDLLGATAKHPAMLWYLDNWMSTKDGFVPTAPGRRRRPLPEGKGPSGLNENYARELLELHTLGVKAGYTQDDVREAARALTGWSVQVNPRQKGFGEFAFHPAAHDDEAKHVFGLELSAGGGVDDGEKLLDFLARHPATAHFIALKLCQKFVSDTPPEALVERVAKVFLASDGDLSATYRAIFESREFWAPEAVGAKTKSPEEFVVSAVRAVGFLDEVQKPLAGALEGMGQSLYRCGPPTGFAEAGSAWVSAGALVSRINFGLRLAKGQVPGVVVMVPPARATPEATFDVVAKAVLGRPPSDSTRATVLRALTQQEADGEVRAVDAAAVAGLLLGSPEFQKQ